VGFIYTDHHFTDISDPLAGAGGTYAFGINDRDQVVGYYYDANGNEHGFIETNGHYTTIDVKIDGVTVTATEINSINNRGEFVGDYTDSSGHIHGFVGENGQFATLDPPGSALAVALGINDNGTVVGFDRMHLPGPATAFLVDVPGNFV